MVSDLIFNEKTLMNRIIILLAGFILSSQFSSQAQFKKGTLMVGTTVGSTSYSSANSDYDYDNGQLRNTDTKTFGFSVGPQLGIFFTRNMVVGATLSLSLTSTHTITNISNAGVNTGTDTKTTNTTLGIGPYLRYYFASQFSHNMFFAQVDGSVATGTGSTSGSGFTATTTTETSGSVSGIFNWNAGGSLGLEHFFDPRIGMDVAVGYHYTHAKSQNRNTTNTTHDANSSVTTATNNYGLATGTNGLTLAAGFHWFF